MASRSRFRGLSTVELLMTIAVISLLASVSAIAVSKVTQNSQSQRLSSDVATMNSAIKLYLSNGGDLTGATSADAVITKLKTSRSKADKATHVGAPSGRMIDNRVTTSPVAADNWRARAIYNASTERFEVVQNVAGFQFVLDDNLAEARTVTEDRDPNAVSYAANSTWVWDHASTANPNAPAGPSTFSTNPNPTDSDPTVEVIPPDPPDPPTGGGGGTDPPPPPAPPRLPWPNIQPDGGAHPEDDFPLSVSVLNVPPATDGEPFYKIDSGSWTPYSGAIDIEMNETLRVQFRTIDSTKFRDGSTRTEFYYAVPDTLSGIVNGDFHSPTGGPTLSYEISNGADTFTHGDPVYILDGEPINSGDPNVLQFDSQSFVDVAPGEKFRLGEFYYHNGNSYYDSHANGVKLRVTINLPERGETFDFNLDLDLVNTPNDPDDATASADYVRITNLQQNINLQINGVGYRMKLEFGATDSFGFSTESSFHVYEGASGRGELLGTFLAN
ncbi:MAG: choice-of-anchor K domain-containing protein [Verrucomicrobiales bacterium]|nr:choice-of-anchor K domain-containing protein [Verrucomicrobiales bacterium]